VTSWPVVFVAVYKLAGPIVHSNLAFCPDTSVLSSIPESSPAKKYADTCFQPHGNFSGCSASIHTKTVIEGPAIVDFLQQHGCIEVTFDGNRGGGVWMPAKGEVGCWAQGTRPDFWMKRDDFYADRGGNGYGRLYWMSSENTMMPYAKLKPWFDSDDPPSKQTSSDDNVDLETLMTGCFSPRLGTRLDFNPDTYHLLRKNCNKFTSESLRHMDLPKFAEKSRKGLFAPIALSATREESSVRQMVTSAANTLMKEPIYVSRKCHTAFFKKEVNCRRVGWTTRRGDCPDQDLGKTRCYDIKDGSSRAPAVDYQDKANGRCAIPTNFECDPKDTIVPCRKDRTCKEAGVAFFDPKEPSAGNYTIYKCLP